MMENGSLTMPLMMVTSQLMLLSYNKLHNIVEVTSESIQRVHIKYSNIFDHSTVWDMQVAELACTFANQWLGLFKNDL